MNWTQRRGCELPEVGGTAKTNLVSAGFGTDDPEAELDMSGRNWTDDRDKYECCFYCSQSSHWLITCLRVNGPRGVEEDSIRQW